MRTLTSREYCHWCSETSEWKYEDSEGNQIIECPICGHKHYRVITGELVRPEIRYRGEVIEDVEAFLRDHPELEDKFQKLKEEARMQFEVSGQRWGQDPVQRGSLTYSYTSSTSADFTSYSDINSSSNYSAVTGKWYGGWN